jgi:hypothetical protein
MGVGDSQMLTASGSLLRLHDLASARLLSSCALVVVIGEGGQLDIPVY